MVRSWTKNLVRIALASLIAICLTSQSSFADAGCALELPESVLSAHSASEQPHIAHSMQPESWRAIDTVVLLPSDFGKNPFTGLSLGLSEAELKADAMLSIAQANLHLRELKLYINVIEMRLFEESEDPFLQASNNRNALDMLQGAVIMDEELPEQRDLALVLARSYFRGSHGKVYGLTYKATSCQSQRYSVAFATQSGEANRLAYMLGHTIAHEVGHFLGMDHDLDSYEQGVSVMASAPATHEFGFSDRSLQQAEARIAPGLAGGSCFAPAAKPGYADDADFDSVPDLQESVAGTDFQDPGSYPSTLKSVVHTPWNSFLFAQNIVELVNPGEETTELTLELLAQNGAVLDTLEFQLAAKEQRDIILDHLKGFEANAYGLVKLSFQGTLDGRTSFYRLSNIGGFEFAYAVPLLNAITDVSSVAFNTFQPSLKAAHASYQVANWLTLVNLSEQLADFRVISFDQSGQVLRTRNVRLAPKARLDIDGGHGFAGAGRVGMHHIIPADPSTQYLSFLTRYGSNATFGMPASKYFFAFPLIARAGSQQAITAPLSTVFNSGNWVELLNTSSSYAEVQVSFRGSNGALLLNTQIRISPLSQYHFDAASLLKNAGFTDGSVHIQSEEDGRIIAHSMSYFRDVEGAMQAMYGIDARQSIADRLNGSYNLFLGAENRIRLINSSSSAVNAVLMLHTEAGVYEQNYNLAAGASRIVGARELGALSESYGVLQVNSERSHALTGDITRIVEHPRGIALAIPTTLR